MSFSAVFKLDGGNPDGYEVVTCDYFFQQATDYKGRPSSTVTGGQIVVMIISTDDARIAAWMLDPFAMKGGSITFFRNDVRATLKELVFEDAYCVQHAERIRSTMQTMFTLSARKITVAGAS